MFFIREATPADLPAITDIYNDAILATTATFDTQPKSYEEQEIWFNDHGSKYPLVVAVLQGTIVGWASLSRWSNRCAYSQTAEISIYVKEGYRSRGIGKKLMESIILRGRKAGLHTVISLITAGNDKSIHLHEAAGFQHIGVMREVGKKRGMLLDVCMMQLIYPQTAAAHEDDRPGDQQP